MYLVLSGDRSKNISTASGVIENTIQGTTVKNSTTVLNAIEIEGLGGTTITIPNANYTANDTIELKVLFKGSSTNTRTLTGVKKITINTKIDTVNSSTIQTKIEVYKP